MFVTGVRSIPLENFDKEELRQAVAEIAYTLPEEVPKDYEEADFDETNHVYVNDNCGGKGRWIATHTIDEHDVMLRRFANKKTGEPTKMAYYCTIEGKRVVPNKYKPAKPKGQFRVEETRRTSFPRKLFTLCCEADVGGWMSEDEEGNTAQAHSQGHVLLSLRSGQEKFIVQLPVNIEVIATRVED